MITTIITLLLLFISTKFNFTYLEDFGFTIIVLASIAIILTILFIIAHLILSKESLDKYKKKWDMPVIIFLGFLYSMIVFILILKIFLNYNSGISFLEHTLILWICLIAENVINTFVFFYTYLFDFKRSIIDSFMFQIRNVRDAMFLFIMFIIILKCTIVGFLFIIIILGIILSLFNK